MSPPIVNYEWLNGHVERIEDKRWIKNHQKKCIIIYSDKCEPSFSNLENCIKFGCLFKLDYVMKMSNINVVKDRNERLYVVKTIKTPTPERKIQNIIYNKMDDDFCIRPVYYGHNRLYIDEKRTPQDTMITFSFIQPMIIDSGPKKFYNYPEMEKSLWYLEKKFNSILDIDSKSSNYIFTDKGVRSIDIELTLYKDSLNKKTADGLIDYDYKGPVTNDGVISEYAMDTFSSEILTCLLSAVIRPDIIDMSPNRQLPVLKLISAINILTPESLHITEYEILNIFSHMPFVKDTLAKSMNFLPGGEFKAVMICILSMVITTLPNITKFIFDSDTLRSILYAEKRLDDIENHLNIHSMILNTFIQVFISLELPSFDLINSFKKIMISIYENEGIYNDTKMIEAFSLINYFIKKFNGDIRYLENIGTADMPVYNNVKGVYLVSNSISMMDHMIMNSYMIRNGCTSSDFMLEGNFMEIYRVNNFCYGLFIPILKNINKELSMKISDFTSIIRESRFQSPEILIEIGKIEINKKLNLWDS